MVPHPSTKLGLFSGPFGQPGHASGFPASHCPHYPVSLGFLGGAPSDSQPPPCVKSTHPQSSLLFTHALGRGETKLVQLSLIEPHLGLPSQVDPGEDLLLVSHPSSELFLCSSCLLSQEMQVSFLLPLSGLEKGVGFSGPLFNSPSEDCTLGFPGGTPPDSQPNPCMKSTVPYLARGCFTRALAGSPGGKMILPWPTEANPFFPGWVLPSQPNLTSQGFPGGAPSHLAPFSSPTCLIDFLSSSHFGTSPLPQRDTRERPPVFFLLLLSPPSLSVPLGFPGGAPSSIQPAGVNQFLH